MMSLYILAPPADVAITELGIIFTLTMFLVMAYWKNIPFFHVFAGAVALFAGWAFADRPMLLISFGGLGMFEFYVAYIKTNIGG